MIDYDVGAIIERLNRRERALTKTPAPRTYIGPRDDAISPLDRPLLLWPTERHLVPAQCWNCGAGRANFDDTNLPYGPQRTGDIACLLCTRVIVRLKADGTRPVLPLPTAEELRPRRGRPPKGAVR